MTYKRISYMQLYGEDFMTGCRKAGMKPDEVGAYISLIVLEWQDQAPLDHDIPRLALRLGFDVRITRRLVDRLVALGKYELRDGALSNARVQKEILAFQTKHAAFALRRRGTLEKPVSYTDSYRDSCPGSYALAIEHLSEKAHENNASNAEDGLYARALPEPEPTITPKAPLQGADDIDAKFEEFWQAYPPGHKQGTGKCKVLFRQAVTGQSRTGTRKGAKLSAHGTVSADELIAAARGYADTNPDPQYTVSPKTWLNEGRWMDGDPSTDATAKTLPPEQQQKHTAEILEATDDWRSTYGPNPWEDACWFTGTHRDQLRKCFARNGQRLSSHCKPSQSAAGSTQPGIPKLINGSARSAQSPKAASAAQAH